MPNNNSIFILENDLPLIVYSYILDYIKSYNLYLNGISNSNIINIEYTTFYNFINLLYPFADDSFYDINPDSLEKLYLI
jgi:hypothetical protein